LSFIGGGIALGNNTDADEAGQLAHMIKFEIGNIVFASGNLIPILCLLVQNFYVCKMLTALRSNEYRLSCTIQGCHIRGAPQAPADRVPKRPRDRDIRD
jgi:hypothetical protein